MKIKGFLTDSIWSIAGLVTMNAVAQIVVYPAWNHFFGSEAYGEILYLISIMNIYAISIGTACNYARITRERTCRQSNEDYNLFMLIASIIAILLCVVTAICSKMTMSIQDVGLYAVLCILTMWRFYADVEYRLTLNYKGCFQYYIIIAIGYLVGIWFVQISGSWALALIPGEAAGLVFVRIRGSVLQGKIRPTASCKSTLILIFTLIGSNLLSNVIFNGDRILLNLMIGGGAVTTYYLSSLMGKTMSLITTPFNSVIIGYLARYKGGIRIKEMNMITCASLAIGIAATAVCVIASHLILPILYPNEYAVASKFFMIGNLAQIIYFISNVLTVILLRFTKAKYQMYINAAYAGAFLALCPLAAYWYGIEGFCWGMLLTCAIRYGYSILLGYIQANAKHNTV